MCVLYLLVLYCVLQRASSSEEVCQQLLRDTQVTNTKDSKLWDLDLIEYVLKVYYPEVNTYKLSLNCDI